MNFTVDKPYLLNALPVALMAAVMASGIASCNKKTEEPEDETEKIVYLPNVAVTSFKLKANKDVMPKLDSVFFSVDLDHGVIFNADSLPVGAKVNKLVPSISYSSAITSALIIMEGGTTRNDTVDYVKNPNDSIDFTGNVKLVLATADNEMKKTYTIKVNVHRQQPDSLEWNETALAALPSRLPSPRNQKTVAFHNKAVSIIEENDGSFTIAQSDDMYANRWDKAELSLPFVPEIRSMAASSDAMYILDDNGNLYTSNDGDAWNPTGEAWNKIIGGYLDTAIGLKTDSEGLKYAQYPLKDISQVAVDPQFPVDAISNFVSRSNKWTSSPVGFFCGGVKADGSLSDDIWAFDGRSWIALSSGAFPAVKGVSLIPYYSFRRTSTSSLISSELEVWMMLGGEMADGSFNRTVYVSYDNGVNWHKGSTMLQLPDIIPPMIGCDNIVLASGKDANLSDAWKVMDKRRKVNWSVDGDIISWECPYIYLIGGFDPAGNLCNTIWRGVLNRLQSVPII
ncbi:MAG: hypothetical protein K2G23_00775 [Muribaculaceae bacterium]|nr:hypothetical protein [Muribaculaceae bacterium]